MTNNLRARPVVALNVDCLAVREHTGIANLAKVMAQEMLADETIDARFFMLRGEVPRRIIERLVEINDGDILWWMSSRLDGRPKIELDTGSSAIGIYPGLKAHRRLFPVEVQVIHDLTVFVTPQFHTAQTGRVWEERMLADMLSCDLLVARSQATSADIRSYFPQVAHIPCLVATGAPDGGEVAALPSGRSPSDYVLVLGTLEPRKNVSFILECLSNHPEILDQHKFVFVGRWGWGGGTQDMISKTGLSHQVAEGKILFAGFVSDEARDQLVARARLVIYVSRYEGLGLPVIEALRVGTPVLTSYSSSLPEVGGDVAHYCDIDSPSSFYDSLTSILSSEQTSNGREARMTWAAGFGFGDSYRRIRDAALAIAQDK